jgi:DNA polymerase-3 subunit delta'
VWPIIGHEWVVELLSRSVQADNTSHAYLFTGPSQIGKTSLAKAFAQLVQCRGVDPPCGDCRSCILVQADRHPDVLMISPEEGRIKIEAIRELQRTVALTAVESGHRVCIISHVDLATPAAANCLLKTLEEPPPRVILVLTADREDMLLPTIVSRCQVLSLRLLSTERTVQALQQRGVDLERARLIGHLARGRIGWALHVSQDERVLGERNQVLDQIEELSTGTYVRRFHWAEQLSKKPDQVPFVLEILTSWWHDVLVLTSESGVQITNIDRQAQLCEWAQRYDVFTAKQVLRSIRETGWRLEHNANLRLALEVLALDMSGRRVPANI